MQISLQHNRLRVDIETAIRVSTEEDAVERTGRRQLSGVAEKDAPKKRHLTEATKISDAEKRERDDESWEESQEQRRKAKEETSKQQQMKRQASVVSEDTLAEIKEEIRLNEEEKARHSTKG